LFISALFDALLLAGMCLYSRHSFRYMLIWFGFINTHVFSCARYSASSCVLVGLLSDNLGYACPDSGAWIIAGFPAEDQPFRVRSGSMADQRQITRISFLPGPSW